MQFFVSTMFNFGSWDRGLIGGKVRTRTQPLIGPQTHPRHDGIANGQLATMDTSFVQNVGFKGSKKRGATCRCIPMHVPSLTMCVF